MDWTLSLSSIWTDIHIITVKIWYVYQHLNLKLRIKLWLKIKDSQTNNPNARNLTFFKFKEAQKLYLVYLHCNDWSNCVQACNQNADFWYEGS